MEEEQVGTVMKSLAELVKQVLSIVTNEQYIAHHNLLLCITMHMRKLYLQYMHLKLIL